MSFTSHCDMRQSSIKSDEDIRPKDFIDMSTSGSVCTTRLRVASNSLELSNASDFKLRLNSEDGRFPIYLPPRFISVSSKMPSDVIVEIPLF